MVRTIYLLILVAAFVGILVWVLFGRRRKARFEANARIPFDEKRESHDDGKRTRSKIR
jgi:cbb3-type cytochrome oxidase subunit 3